MTGSPILASLFLAAITLQGGQTALPVEFISRAETVMSLVLARTPDIPAIRNTEFFPDVPKGVWHEAFMLYAQKMGIVSAEAGTNKLRPDASLTRAEFLKMLTFTFGLPLDNPHTFSDVPRDAWYAPYAGVASRHKFFDFKSPTLLEPQRIVTRADVQKALEAMDRMMNSQEEKPALEKGLAADQSATKLQLYTVISTRREKVTFIDAQSAMQHAAASVEIPQTLPEMRTEILTLVNQARMKEGLSALTYSSQLEQSAQAYAERMSDEGFFTHIAPDGETIKDRVSRTGFYNRGFSFDCLCVKGYALGENLARGQKTPKEAFEAWMKSPSHRAAILNGDYTFLGIGAKAGVWVQHFGGVIVP